MDEYSLLSKVLLTESFLGGEAADFIAESFSQGEVVTRRGPGEGDEQGIVEIIAQSEETGIEILN